MTDRTERRDSSSHDSDDELGVDARALLRAARAADDPSAAATRTALRRFAEQRAQSRGRIHRAEARRPLAWALAALAMSGSLAAFAQWGEVWLPTLTAPAGEETPEAAEPVLRAKPVLRKAAQRITSGSSALANSTALSNSTAPSSDASAASSVTALPSVAISVAQSAEPAAAPLTTLQPVPSLAVRDVAEDSSAARAQSIAAELQLITQARDALRARHYAHALTLTARHEQDFRAGTLLQERLAIEAMAHCRGFAHKERGAAFIARFPESIFAQRIATDCELINPVPEPPSSHVP